MNTKLLLLAISVAAFSSCSTVYKSGQTPDDVYFSPVRTYGEDRKEEQKDEVKTYSTEERIIRLGINDYRYRNFDNDYGYNPYKYGFNHGYYYNPYYWPYPVYSSAYYYPVYGSYNVTPSNPKITTPRTTNLNTYHPGNIKTSTYTKTGGTKPVKAYNNSNNGSAVGNVIRQLFTPGETSNSSSNSPSSNSNSSSNSSRTYSPSGSSSSSSGSSSSGSGSGGISRPSRGGGN